MKDVLITYDYYAFGSLMPGRSYNSGEYEYGFNGKRMDNEISGNGNSYDYGFRIYNPRIGKFLSVDPLTKSYPMLTPYQFASNTPIQAIDLDGLESVVVISIPQENGEPKITKYNWSDVVPKQSEGPMGTGVAFYDYDKKAKKVILTSYQSIEQLTGFEELSKLSSKPEPLIEFKTSVEVGVKIGAKAKVFGIGGQIEGGLSKELFSTSFTENGIVNSGTQKSTINAGLGAGLFSINASTKISSSEATVGGNFFLGNFSSSTSGEESSRITIFDIGASFGIGGNISLTIDDKVLNSSNISTPEAIRPKSESVPDNTATAPIRVEN